MIKRLRSSLGSTPITCWSVMHWALTPRGMPDPQAKKTTGTFRPLERESPHSASLEALRGGTELLQGDDRSLPSSSGDCRVAELRKPEGGPRLSAHLCRREACRAVLEPRSRQKHTEPRKPKPLGGLTRSYAQASQKEWPDRTRQRVYTSPMHTPMARSSHKMA